MLVDQDGQATFGIGVGSNNVVLVVALCFQLGRDHGVGQDGGTHFSGLLECPAGRQVTIKRIMGAGLVGDHIGSDSACYQLRENVGGISQQADGYGIAVM